MIGVWANGLIKTSSSSSSGTPRKSEPLSPKQQAETDAWNERNRLDEVKNTNYISGITAIHNSLKDLINKELGYMKNKNLINRDLSNGYFEIWKSVHNISTRFPHEQLNPDLELNTGIPYRIGGKVEPYLMIENRDGIEWAGGQIRINLPINTTPLELENAIHSVVRGWLPIIDFFKTQGGWTHTFSATVENPGFTITVNSVKNAGTTRRYTVIKSTADNVYSVTHQRTTTPELDLDALKANITAYLNAPQIGFFARYTEQHQRTVQLLDRIKLADAARQQ
jgi:hypothetical protein